MGAAGLCPEGPPGLLYHARAPLFGRGGMLQTRFCLCTQYCHWTRAGAISALPIRAFRACGCCWPMPRRSPDSSATRALLSLAVAVCYRRVSACAHSTVIGREQGPFWGKSAGNLGEIWGKIWGKSGGKSYPYRRQACKGVYKINISARTSYFSLT